MSLKKFASFIKAQFAPAPKYRVVQKNNGLYYGQEFAFYTKLSGRIYQDIAGACQTIGEAEAQVDRCIAYRQAERENTLSQQVKTIIKEVQ